MRYLFFSAAVSLVTLSGQTPKQTPLARLVDAELSRFPAKTGLYVKHLTTGEELAVRGDDHFNSASVIKIPVMILAYRMADQKKLDLAERYTIKPSDFRGGSGIFRYHDAGLNPTLRDIITEMIITSDNTATDIMIAKVGGKEKVNEFLKQNGIATSFLVQTVFELFRKPYEVLDPENKSLTPEDVFAMQSNVPAFTEPRKDLIKRLREGMREKNIQREMMKLYAEDEKYWLGVVTPTEIGRLLEGIEKGTFASKASSAEMVRIMRGQQSGARRIPHYLNVPVGHKTGDFPPIVANDVGMIYAKSGTIIMSFFTLGNTGVYAETEDRMGQLARLIVEYFDGPN
ncbi:MAG TPA: serine hydrolase [Isosphaeraceae bacterium]|nr:serine hydrolase [Isosphaeraceae bacterium]